MHKRLKKSCTIIITTLILLTLPQTALANTPATPVRSFFEDANAAVEWYEPLQRVKISLNGNVARFYINGHAFYINNTPANLLGTVSIESGTAFMYKYDANNILYLLTQPLPENTPATYTHGQIAYRYLHFIEENLPSRIPFSQRERDTAEWISRELIYMGHPADMIRFQEFPIQGMMAMVVDMLNLNCEPVDTIPQRLRSLLAMQNIYCMEDILQHTFLEYSQNVILTVPGQSQRRIIVAAHYDSPNSPGISDNASGIVTLLESAYRILYLDHYYTITYIFFGAEETGLIGAFYYVDSLSPECAATIALMINIDVIFDGFRMTYGLGYHCEETHTQADNSATRVIEELANFLNAEFGFELIRERYGIYVPTDQLAFLPLGIPVLVLYSLYNYTPAGLVHNVSAAASPQRRGLVLHTQNDNLAYINENFPGLIENALFAYSLFLEAVLTLPAGSLD